MIYFAELIIPAPKEAGILFKVYQASVDHNDWPESLLKGAIMFT